MKTRPMKTRPILFSGAMVQAILAGRKTQTRRVVKPQPTYSQNSGLWHGKDCASSTEARTLEIMRLNCPYGEGGDLLWVRECFALECDREYFGENMPKDSRPVKFIQATDREFESDYHLIPHYKADGIDPDLYEEEDGKTKWKPSIHMPRWASRLTLAITDIRVERLQYLSENDAIAEGCEATETFAMSAVDNYELLWKSINGAESWDANPWVWVIEFKPFFGNVDSLLEARAA